MKEMENLSEKFLKISQALLAWLILLILSPLLLLLCGSLCIWKYGVLWVIVKLFKRKFLEGFQDAESVFAVDRYWESSRSSLGLIVEVEGTINVDTFREEFRKKILDLNFDLDPSPNSSSDDNNGSSFSRKPFAKLMQIPATFAGYYYWQKANYFLIHEHIRQINQPTDELGLKKAVGTLMTLPFPNRRPLWEILVYSNYLGTSTVGRGTTCGAALFIRIHRSVTDSQGLMNLLQCMIAPTEASISKSVQIASNEEIVKESNENEAKRGPGVVAGVYNLILSKIPNLVFFPIRTYRFAQDMIKVPEGIAKSESCGEWDSANASWTSLSSVLVRKICLSQNPHLPSSAVEMSLILEGLTSQHHPCANVPEEKGVPVRQGKCQTSVLVPVSGRQFMSSSETFLPNEKTFLPVKCPCISSISPNKTALLKCIHQQLQAHQMGQNLQIFRIYLKLLGLLPRHILRYVLMSKKWGAGCFLFEQFPSDGIQKLDKDEHKMFGLYQISQVVPLVGLQWAHTVASATTFKWQGNIVMSLIANAGILGPMTQGNPQEHAERIMRSLPEELEKLADDAEDHGFVSIPIA